MLAWYNLFDNSIIWVKLFRRYWDRKKPFQKKIWFEWKYEWWVKIVYVHWIWWEWKHEWCALTMNETKGYWDKAVLKKRFGNISWTSNLLTTYLSTLNCIKLFVGSSECISVIEMPSLFTKVIFFEKEA